MELRRLQQQVNKNPGPWHKTGLSILWGEEVVLQKYHEGNSACILHTWNKTRAAGKPFAAVQDRQGKARDQTAEEARKQGGQGNQIPTSQRLKVVLCIQL